MQTVCKLCDLTPQVATIRLHKLYDLRKLGAIYDELYISRQNMPTVV